MTGGTPVGSTGTGPGTGSSRRPNNGGSMFAAFAVLFLASMIVFFLIAVISDAPLVHGLFAAGSFLAIVSVFTGVRKAITDPVTDYAAWIFREKRGNPLEGYEPKKKPSSVRKYGTNNPTTAKEVREIKQRQNVWNPTDSKRKRRQIRNDPR